MAGINGVPLNALGAGAVSVPISKYISNATHTGAAQQVGKDTAQIQDTATTANAQSGQEAQSLPGLKVSYRDDGTQCFQTDSGLIMNTSGDGKITSIIIPGEGVIQPRDDGNFVLQTSNGADIPVQPYGSDKNDFEGYTYKRRDGSSVHFNIADMSLGYISDNGKVCQNVEPTGVHTIGVRSSFRDPKTAQITNLETTVTVTPNGQIDSTGYTKDLRVGANKLQFTNLANNRQVIDLPATIPALVPPPKPEKPEVAPRPANNGPILMEDTPPPPHPEPPVNIPPKPIAHAVLPSQVGFDRDEQGQVAVMLRSGLTMIYTQADGAAVRDPRVPDKLLPASMENFTSADGRIEKQFRFTDAAGVNYRCFQESMDVLVDSADGNVRQHILPNGTILGQILGPDGQFKRFEVTPKGEVKADPGLTIPPSSGDRGQAYLKGPDGRSIQVALPYPIPSDQANAGMYADMYGSPKYPQSGERLPAFNQGSPPNQPNLPPGPPPGPQNPPPNAGPNPNAGPMAGFDPTLGPMAGSNFFPNPGQVQQPVPPGWGAPNPGYYGAPPPNPGPYPNAYGSYPGANPWGAPNPGNNYAPYPGQGGPQPGFTGQTPSYPGQMPDGPTLMERMRADFERNNQAIWGQLAASQAGTTMMIAGQTMSSAMSGMQMGMAMWPRGMWYSPFCW
ncbi:hypothetical protein JST97_27780 [bacterium]|nr:hypothetical protein [bacterium]